MPTVANLTLQEIELLAAIARQVNLPDAQGKILLGQAQAKLEAHLAAEPATLEAVTDSPDKET